MKMLRVFNRKSEACITEHGFDFAYAAQALPH